MSDVKTLSKLRRQSDEMGCRLRALRKPVRRGGKAIRYVLWDGYGDLWFTSLAEVETQLARVRRRFETPVRAARS
jgi:hypothetical protein